MIKYLIGDATQPTPVESEGSPFNGGVRLICHICNTRGGWGRGFVTALSKRWPEPEREYRRWSRGDYATLFMDSPNPSRPFELGQIQVVKVEPRPLAGPSRTFTPPIWVVNMISQEGYGPANKAQHQDGLVNTKPPIRYDALEQCLKQVESLLALVVGTVHMPRIGTGLGGGTWSEIEPIIERTLSDWPVYVYDLPGSGVGGANG